MIYRLRQTVQRFLALFRAPALDCELNAEMAAHLQLAIDENLQRFMPPGEARQHTLVQFGGAQQSREDHHQARSFQKIDDLLQDLYLRRRDVTPGLRRRFRRLPSGASRYAHSSGRSVAL